MTTGELIQLLEREQRRFGRIARATKLSTLRDLSRRTIGSGRLLFRLHEALCFVRAYPDDLAVLDAADQMLRGVVLRVAHLPPREAARLDDTGLAGTTISCPLSLAAARWLAARFPEATEIDWNDPPSADAVSAVLPLLVATLDEEALVEANVPYRAWLAAARKGARGSDLAWLLARLAARGPRAARARALYDRLEPRIRWELRESSASRTSAAIPGRPVVFQRRPLRRRPGLARRRIPGPAVAMRQAGPREAQGLVDAARAAVTVRYREVHSFTFADPRDVVVAGTGEGVEIVWFGVRPERRLPLRAHYGYLLLRSGVPIGYGDASLLFDWCEIAHNVFETFRQGESAPAFLRILAFLYQRFGVRAFRLSPYQLGQGNDEAIASGAFWFYHKLGFRPARPAAARLASEERRRIASDPTYRSSPETLMRLAEGGAFLDVGVRHAAAVARFDVRPLGLAAVGTTAAAARGTVARWLGVRRWRAWPLAERIAFAGLAPILAALPDRAAWSRAARRALVAVIRAKGGRCEADYLRRMRRHARFRAAILALGRT